MEQGCSAHKINFQDKNIKTYCFGSRWALWPYHVPPLANQGAGLCLLCSTAEAGRNDAGNCGGRTAPGGWNQKGCKYLRRVNA